MAWELLTDVYKLPKERLYVTYFGGDAKLGLPADDEAKQLWLDIGMPVNQVLPFGPKENFWGWSLNDVLFVEMLTRFLSQKWERPDRVGPAARSTLTGLGTATLRTS
jgi:hypothetical protein